MDPFRFGIKSKEEGRKKTRLRRAEDVQTEERVDEVAAGRKGSLYCVYCQSLSLSIELCYWCKSNCLHCLVQ